MWNWLTKFDQAGRSELFSGLLKFFCESIRRLDRSHGRQTGKLGSDPVQAKTRKGGPRTGKSAKGERCVLGSQIPFPQISADQPRQSTIASSLDRVGKISRRSR